jgi:hypothetical protein
LSKSSPAVVHSAVHNVCLCPAVQPPPRSKVLTAAQRHLQLQTASWALNDIAFCLVLSTSPPAFHTSPLPDVLVVVQLCHRGNLNASLIENEEAGYVYRYQYNGVGEGVTWLSSRNYMVIDLAAGPTTYGPLIRQGGAATPEGIPSVKVCVCVGGGGCTAPGNKPYCLPAWTMLYTQRTTQSIFTPFAAGLSAQSTQLPLPVPHCSWHHRMHSSSHCAAPLMPPAGHVLQHDESPQDGRAADDSA